METEDWAPIPGLSDYEASNLGQIRRLSRQQVLPQHRGNDIGHRRVTVKPHGRSYCGMYVHRLVLMAFVGPCPEGMQACHNDGNARNNHLSNLRWDTPSSNMHDRVKHGTHQNANRTHCPKGHPLDAVKNHSDGTFWQRRCSTCTREANRERERFRHALKETCPQGHPFDGVAYWPDGSERQRYCKTCRSDSVSRQMTERHAQNRAEKTHCKHGHPMDGLRKRPGGLMVPYCKTCLRESSRRNHERKKQQT